MMMRSRKANRAGFTLVEVLVAMTVFGALMALTLGVLDQQVRAFYNGSAQMDATQHLRFTMSALEKDLPTAGSGVPAAQPFLVYADTHVVAFNADYASNLAADAFAVYVDTTLPNLQVTSLTRARRITIPRTSFQYPDTTYRVGASPSPAETIIFYFQQDTSTARADDYLFWRQVNDQAPELLARNILRPAAGPFFRYRRLRTPAVGPIVLDSVPSGWLPLRHTQPVHLSPTDVGVPARIDSVRAVDVRFRTTDDRRNAQERIYTVARTISLPNAGKTARKTCGDEPLNTGMNFTAAADTLNGGPIVRLSWQRSVDESAGERDVNRYLLWRSTTLPVGTGDPFQNIPAGAAPPYIFVDGGVTAGTTYYYAISAQDCTPSFSTQLTRTINVP
jgi:prepilin-type N-terminal cleavage/methylation domain-containing protein